MAKERKWQLSLNLNWFNKLINPLKLGYALSKIFYAIAINMNI